MLYFSFFRLLQHTYNDPNSVCRVDTLFEKYVDNCSNNDIPSVSPNSFKQTVSKLWDINSTSTTSGGERAYVYKGLKCVENPQNTPIIEEHLPSGWFVIAKDHSGVRVAIKCDVSVNGTPLLKEVHMDSEYKCDIYISNKCIAPHALGLPDNLATTSISPHTYQKWYNHAEFVWEKRWRHTFHRVPNGVMILKIITPLGDNRPNVMDYLILCPELLCAAAVYI